MRIYANLPPFLWDKFYLTASHLHAKTTTKSLQGKTPWELWYGQKPDYSYMWEIGCQAFVLILNRHNPKIYEQSLECILIGYDLKSKSYRCYNHATKQVHCSYHVRFIESHEGHTPKTRDNSVTQPEGSLQLDNEPVSNLFQPLQNNNELTPTLQLLDQIHKIQQLSPGVACIDEPMPQI